MVRLHVLTALNGYPSKDVYISYHLIDTSVDKMNQMVSQVM